MINTLTARMRSSSVALKRLFALPAIVGSIMIANPALAQDTYNFTYLFQGGGMETGSLTGILQSDGNHFTVTGGSVGYNGAPTIPLSGVTSLDNVAGGGGSSYGYNGDNSPVVTLDKSYFDLYAGDSNGSQFYFGLNDNYTNTYYGLNNGAAQSDVLSGGEETFDAARFSASVVGAAPEPASWALMILGFGIAGTVLRRRQQVALRIAYA